MGNSEQGCKNFLLKFYTISKVNEAVRKVLWIAFF